MWLAALNVKYRDIRYAIPFLVQLWLFASPVIYPASLVPPKWKWVLAGRIPAKLFIINENGDYFWCDRLHLGAIRQFVLFRSGLAGAGAVRTIVRLISFPFTLLYLLLYATTAHARRVLR